MNKITFIDAVRAIDAHPDYQLCDDETELDGSHSSICIYYDLNCVGKLRWNPVKVDIDQEHINRLVRFLVNEKGRDIADFI